MQTTPLAKAITTTEGVLTVLVNIALGLAALIPAHGLNPTVAAAVAGANTVALTLQRGLVKAKALQNSPLGEKLIEEASTALSGQVVPAPSEPVPTPPAPPAPAPVATRQVTPPPLDPPTAPNA